MSKVHAYLNFNGNCEAAFNFYSEVFNTPTLGMHRMSDLPADPNYPIPEDAKSLIMHTAIKINEHSMIMGSDCVESFGQKAIHGNSCYVMIDTDTAAEAERVYNALSVNAMKIEMPLAEQFWAELYASFQDQFGIYWMIHFEGNKAQQ
jgi:PhnB protein